MFLPSIYVAPPGTCLMEDGIIVGCLKNSSTRDRSKRNDYLTAARIPQWSFYRPRTAIAARTLAML